MLTANHAATGAVIALNITNPIVALPLAFVSHFALDALPHFGYKEGGINLALKKPFTYFVLFLDALGCLILLYILWGGPLMAFVGALVADSPDLYNFYRFFILQKRIEKPMEQLNKFTQFHKKIQWGERPWGILVDIAYFSTAAYVIHALV